MKETFKQEGFQELCQEEMALIDGGIDWNLVGGTLATSGGAAIGAYTPV